MKRNAEPVASDIPEYDECLIEKMNEDKNRMAVRDGVSAHFVWGNPFYAYGKNSSEGRCILFGKRSLLPAEQQRKYDYFFLVSHADERKE